MCSSDLLALLLAAAAAITAVKVLGRELHTHLPASTWLAVESVEALEERIYRGEPLVYALRALRHREHTEQRTAVLSCRPLNEATGPLQAIWTPYGEPQRRPRQHVAPAVIGYEAEEPVPEALAEAERLDGLERWRGSLPLEPHACILAFRWRIRTGAGAEHEISARFGQEVIIGGARPALALEDGPDSAPLAAPTAAAALEAAETPEEGTEGGAEPPALGASEPAYAPEGDASPLPPPEPAPAPRRRSGDPL